MLEELAKAYREACRAHAVAVDVSCDLIRQMDEASQKVKETQDRKDAALDALIDYLSDWAAVPPGSAQ